MLIYDKQFNSIKDEREFNEADIVKVFSVQNLYNLL